MEILAAVIIIFATVMHVFIPDTSSPDVQGVKIAHGTSIDDSVVDSTESGSRRDIKQTALDEAHAKRDEAREDFQEKLEQIRNTVKRRIVERTDSRLININERWTTHFDNVLSRLTQILAKIGTRADKLEEEGLDVSLVRDAITVAEAVIGSAQEAIEAQAESGYIIEITDEVELRDSVKVVRDQLHDDLTATRDLVKEARESVHDALQALKDARVGDNVRDLDSE